MKVTQQLIDLITDRVGFWNTDIMSGWEEGLKGRVRIGGKLFDRCAPEHLTGQRYRDWNLGLQAAYAYAKSIHRETRFLGTGPDGPIHITRKGWVARTKVVTQMERAGAFGDVSVFYLENGDIKRSVTCGI